MVWERSIPRLAKHDTVKQSAAADIDQVIAKQVEELTITE